MVWAYDFLLIKEYGDYLSLFDLRAANNLFLRLMLQYGDIFNILLFEFEFLKCFRNYLNYFGDYFSSSYLTFLFFLCGLEIFYIFSIYVGLILGKS